MKGYKSNATISLEQQETTRKVTIEIPEDEANKVQAGLLKINHLKNLYSDYCILNQEFLSYVVSCKLSLTQYKLILFLMSEMDRDNKILINNQILIQKLKASEPTIIDAIKKLTEKKIIVRQKLGVSRYELQINYDILNPQLAFKDKATKENVERHKALITQETPYLKRENLFGEIDLVEPKTGEIFYTYAKDERSKHLIGTEKYKKIENNVNLEEEYDSSLEGQIKEFKKRILLLKETVNDTNEDETIRRNANISLANLELLLYQKEAELKEQQQQNEIDNFSITIDPATGFVY